MSVSLKSLCSNVLPAGTYKAVVEDIKFKNEIVSLDLQITYRITDGANKGKAVFETMPEGAFSFKLASFAKATGLDMNREFPDTKALINYVIKTAATKVLMIEVIIKAYNGSDFNNVKSYAPVPGSTTTTDDVLKDFDIEPIKGTKPHLDDELPFETENASSDVEPKLGVEDLFSDNE